MSVSSPFIHFGKPTVLQTITARKTLRIKNRINNLYQFDWRGLMLPRTNGKMRNGRFNLRSLIASLRSSDQSNGGKSIKNIEQSAIAALFDLKRFHFSLKSPSRIQFPPIKNCDRLIKSIEKGKPTTIRSNPVKCRYGCKNRSGFGSISR